MYDQKVELRHLRYFVAEAEELHFSRAAEKLQIAQPPLSQQIRQLEHIVGVRLFERNHHSVMLTDAGQVYLKETPACLCKHNKKGCFHECGDTEGGRRIPALYRSCRSRSIARWLKGEKSSLTSASIAVT
jgi:hypothetical protein